MKRAVFLDRDGVINKAIVRGGRPYPPSDLSSVEVLPGVADALRALHVARWMLIVVTNQPDVARGRTKLAEVEAINQYLMQSLPIDEFRTCYHDNADRCCCRKPLPGSLISAAEDHGIDLTASYMVGDRWRDIEAGENAGCKTFFLDYGYKEKYPLNFNYKVSSLAECAKIILGK